MSYKEIKVEIRGAAQIITINRPDAENKLSVPCMREMTEALLAAEENGDVAAVILTSEGEYFCNGGELGDFRIKSPQEIREFGKAFIKVHTTICKITKPVIAAVTGHALGGGMNLAEICDLAVAAEEVRFGVPEMKNGLAPMMALTGVANAFTRKTAMELALFGVELTARQALAKGLVNYVCPKEQVLDKALELARELSLANPFAASVLKELYYELENEQYEQKLKKGLDLLVALLKSGECKEVLDAREQGRRPDYRKGDA